MEETIGHIIYSVYAIHTVVYNIQQYLRFCIIFQCAAAKVEHTNTNSKQPMLKQIKILYAHCNVYHDTRGAEYRVLAVCCFRNLWCFFMPSIYTLFIRWFLLAAVVSVSFSLG